LKEIERNCIKENVMSVKKDNPTRVILKNVRVSYCNLWLPQTVTDKEGNVKKDKNGNPVTQYSCQLLVPKNDKFAKENETNIDAAINYLKSKEKSKLANKNGVVPSNLKIAKRDGDTDPTYEGDSVYKDMWVVNATNKKGKPGIIDINRQPINDEQEIYSGMWVYASVTFGAYDGEGKGIAAYINNVMKLRDDERLDGRIEAADEFEAFDDEIDKTATI
jgi:Protein of unknown function (DUF2815)